MLTSLYFHRDVYQSRKMMLLNLNKMHILGGFQLLLMLNVVLSSKKSKEVESAEEDDSILDKILNDPQLSAAMDDPDKLLSLIRTRFSGGLDEDEDRTGHCRISEDRSKMIIKTDESTKAGAIFLSAPRVQSRQDCIDECCSNASCTTAVIKEMDEKSESTGCYLFNCLLPNVCHFSYNKGFSAVDVTHQLPSNGQTSTSKSVTETVVKAIQGHLYSACDVEKDCYESENVQCTSGYCLCQPNYHAVGDVCRKNCGQYEFQCANKNEPNKVECVPVYNQCDGDPQCGDGSDEHLCPDDSTSSGTTPKPEIAIPKYPSSVGTKTNRAPQPSSVAIAKAAKSTTHVPLNVPTSNSSVTEHQPFQPVTSDNHDIALENHKEWTVPAVKGAIIALVLGMIIVIVLLLFAGCQIHRMRWRSRKVRRRNGTDADYLINGMYL